MHNSAFLFKVPLGQKETPAPVNREGLRKKFPRLTQETKHTYRRSSKGKNGVSNRILSDLQTPTPVEFDRIKGHQISSMSARVLSNFIIQTSQFAAGVSLEGLGYGK